MSNIKLTTSTFSLLLCICLISGCSDQSTKQKPGKPSDDFRSYPVDPKSTELKMADAIGSLEIMLLEDTDQSLISDVSIPIRDQNTYVFLANSGKDIMFFDDRGKFIRKVNRFGEGPEEYTSILDFWIEAGTLYILNAPGRVIKKYTLDGDFIGSEKLPSMVGHMYPLNNYYLLQTNHHPYQDSLYFKWVLTDKAFNPIATHLPFNTSSIFDASFPSNYIRPYNSGLIFYSVFTDSLYQLTNNEFSPLAHIDFGDEWYWKDKPNANTKELNEVQSSDKAWDLQLNISNDFIFGRTPLGFQGFMSFVIDRNTGLVSNLNMNKPDGELFILDLEMIDDQKFLFSLPADEISLFLAEFDSSKIKFRKGTSLDKIESQENPVFIWVDFKKSE